MARSALDLPEIQQLVLEHITKLSDQLSVRLVCRAWLRSSLPSFWAAPLPDLVLSVMHSDSPRLGEYTRYMRRLKLKHRYADIMNKLVTSQDFGGIELPNLKSLRIVSYKSDEWKALLSALLVPSLNKLELSGTMGTDEILEMLIVRGFFLRALTALTATMHRTWPHRLRPSGSSRSASTTTSPSAATRSRSCYSATSGSRF